MPGFPGGSQFLEHGAGTMSRASGAYVPDDGRTVSNNVPRVTPQRIPYNTWRPKVYFTHDPSLTKMRYQASQDAANNLLSREVTFAAQFPEFTKIPLGTSNGARPISAFRLGPVGRKHFVIVQSVHGNEIDGVEGTFKAFEILAREPEFQAFRDEWTLFFVTALNPDGWFSGLRNLAEVGPNGKTINLNRNWNWFWDEYVETGFESKGSAAESSVEATALLDYFRGTGPFAGQGAVEFGFMMDQHANQGVGKRYQSRDRIWRGTAQGPASDKALANAIPGSYLTVYLDYYTWRAAKALTKIRSENALVPGSFDYDVSYRRSRFRPHMHAYFASQQTASLAIEEVKVANAFNNLETFASAADFRMDYVVSSAAMVTSTFWQWEDAVLVEQAGRNIMKNSHFEQWQAEDVRPGNFTSSRLIVARNPHVPGQIVSPIRYFDDSGEAITITSNTDVRLRASSTDIDLPSEYTRACNVKLGVYAVVSPEMSGLFKFDIDAAFNTGFAGTPDVVITRTQLMGTALHYSADDAVDIIGGGTAFPSTGAITGVSRITGISNTTPTQTTTIGNINTARMFHASADNFLDFPGSGVQRVYIFGGWDDSGTPVRLTSIEVWNPSTLASVNSAVVIPGGAGVSEACAVFHPPTDKVFIFGGHDSGGLRTEILEYTPGATPATDTISTHATAMAVNLKNIAGAYSTQDEKIWLFGGELTSGDMSPVIYSFDPATGVFQVEPVPENLDDDEDNHDSEDDDPTSPWVKEIGRHCAVTNVEFQGDVAAFIQVIGGRETTGATNAKLADVYQFDPVDEVIGLQRLSDYGYFRYSVAVAEREYEPGVSSTEGTMAIKVTGMTGRSYINSNLTFSPSGVTGEFLEVTANANGDTLLRVKELDGVPVVADIVTADASTEDLSATVASVPADDFALALDETNQWNDPSAAWEFQAAGFIAASQGPTGSNPLILRNGIDWENNIITTSLLLVGTVTEPIKVAIRATFSGATLTDGYTVEYDPTSGSEEWKIVRTVSSTPTTVFTLDVSADATRQVTSPARSLVITIEDQDPVRLNVVFDFLTVFDEHDFSNDRIRNSGEIALMGGTL